jgi:hypothetical protein
MVASISLCCPIGSASSLEIASNSNLMHTISMRTTVTLDDDAYELAMLCAKGRGITLGAAISEFVRKGQEARLAERSSSPRLKRLPNGMLVFAAQGRVITNEMVKAALDEDDD